MDQRIERVLSVVNLARRTAIKKLIVIGFAVPAITSYAVSDLAYGGVGSPGTSVSSSAATSPTPTRTVT